MALVHPLDMRAVQTSAGRRLPRASSLSGSVEPPLLSPVSVSALFSAIASDSFFELVASQHLTLSSPSDSESDLSTLGSPTNCSNDLIEFDIDVNRYVDGFGKSLLHHACRFGNVQIAKSLLYHGANASAQCPNGRTPFHDAISSRSKHTLELLKLLFDHDPAGISLVDINGGHVLHLAAIHGRLDVIEWCASLEEDDQSRFLLPLTISSLGGRNMLHYAAYNGRLDVLAWLVDPDRNVRSTEFDIGALDGNGYSLLHYAAMGAHMEVCKWLVLVAPGRHNISVQACNSEGKRAIELAKHDDMKQFLAMMGQCPKPPSAVRCIGTDHCSLGIAWTLEDGHRNERVRDTLAPRSLHLEYCRKPVGLPHVGGVLALLVTSTRSEYLLHWEQLEVLIPPNASEYWLCGLEEATEYLVRIRSMNRNGYSSYAYPKFMNDFTTTTSSLTASPSPSRTLDSQLAGKALVAFIGNLRFELLEGRGLPAASNSRQQLQAPLDSAGGEMGKYYSIVSVEVPSNTTAMAEKSGPLRRRTVPMTLQSRRNTSPPTSPCISSAGRSTWRQLYVVRSLYSAVQQRLICAGSSIAQCHPQFGFTTTFRVPDPSLAVLKIQIRRETRTSDDCIGFKTIRVLDLVRGLPSKLQWVTLGPVSSSGRDARVLSNGGNILIRTRFITDGTPLPLVEPSTAAPSISNNDGWLDNNASPAIHNLTISTGSGDSGSSGLDDAGNHSPTSPSRHPFERGAVAIDELGFRMFDPQLQLINGKWELEASTRKPFAYYELLNRSIDRQQARKWEACQSERSFSTSAACQPTPGDLYNTASDLDTDALLRKFAWQGFPSSNRAAMYLQIVDKKRSKHPSDYFCTMLRKAEAAAQTLTNVTNALTPLGESATATTADLKPTSIDDISPASDHDAKHDWNPSARVKFEAARKHIGIDLQRTFAGNQSWINTLEGQRSLGRVLEAYAVHNPTVGYCQSMTFVVGRLLCLFHHYRHELGNKQAFSGQSTGENSNRESNLQFAIEEEDTFWVTLTVFDDFFSSFFTNGMEGLHVDASVLEELIRTRLPQLDRHFQQLQTPHVGLLLATQWFLPVFCAGFPTQTTFRILDAVLLEGPTAIFSVAIALLRVSQADIIAEHLDYLHLFRHLKARDQRLHDSSFLMEVAQHEYRLFPAEKVTELQQHYARELRYKAK